MIPLKGEPMKLEETQLSLLVDMKNPQSVMYEVNHIVHMIFPEFDLEPVNRVFRDVMDLFNGQYPGYRWCNVKYHDIHHTIDILLAMTRLIHGAMISHRKFTKKDLVLGLISALLHDTGYIQTEDDHEGTGAKYTLIHISRSIQFMKKYFNENGYSEQDIRYSSAILKCTGLNVKIDEIHFLSLENELLGKMLGTADLLGQMADRAYLEKLPYLYQEFKEGNVPGFESELDLLKMTPGFFNMTKERFKRELGSVNGFMPEHFRVRWDIEKDLYMSTIEKSIRYLQFVLENHQDNYRKYLRRRL